ncbi:hypothetical protein EDC02_3244 [Micromonospora sp. Llam0]|uniref:hypothetical protein n=1 Tax=Micromonospora sp. Llam0 TaxID=2485143 RepID=UPI000FA70EBF|nr:hypothetical protein [Micromonospora sp. Llam0]ROO61311.1 hypothetical protein EDC02_3244 [Micromonospora sp. Llam0]
MKRALIFMQSGKPETYINVLSVLHDQYGIDHFTFVAVTSGSMDSASPNLVLDNMQGRLRELSQGTYTYEQKTVSLPESARKAYGAIASKIQTNSDIRSEKVDEIPRLLDEYKKVDTVAPTVDITGLSKVPAIKVTILGLRHHKEFYTYELQQQNAGNPGSRAPFYYEDGASYSYTPITRDTGIYNNLKGYVPRERITITAAALLLIGFSTLTITLIVDPQHIALSLVSLLANILGSLAAAYQFISHD